MLNNSQWTLSYLANHFGFEIPVLYFTIVFIILVLWVFYWKGMALWKAARREEKWWFIVMLVINTLGILEILYIYYFSERENINKQDN